MSINLIHKSLHNILAGGFSSPELRRSSILSYLSIIVPGSLPVLIPIAFSASISARRSFLLKLEFSSNASVDSNSKNFGSLRFPNFPILFNFL